MPLNQIKVFYEDVCVCVGGVVSGLQLGNLKEWACPQRRNPENITISSPFKAAAVWWEGVGSWSPQGQEVPEERLL